MKRLKIWGKGVKRDALALWLAARDPRTPWYAKLLALALAAYAFSLIDLIPDFIPIIGYLDDIIIIPLGILLVIKLIEPALMTEFRLKATQITTRPVSIAAAGVFVLIWCGAAIFFLALADHTFRLDPLEHGPTNKKAPLPGRLFR